MNRRAALHALGVGGAAFLKPRRAWSQKPPPVVAVPLIAAGPDDPIIIELRKGLVAYGYIDGKNIQILYRSSGGTVERLPTLLRELVRLKVDIIVAGAAPIVVAARDATSTIPIIMVGWDYDPVAAGFVDSLSHPGGNVTGVYLSTEETTGKRLGLITELLPGVSHVAVLYDDFGKRQYQYIEPAARAAKVQVHPIEVAGLHDFGPALKRAKAQKASAALVPFSPLFYVNRTAIADAALAQRLPTIFEISFMVQAGGLISYGPELSYGWRRAGYFVSRILAGVQPSDLPVERPREYRLVVNVRTAKALGITVPEPILLRADEIIR
jgi:putative ABC transport system substrate-binding protein